MDYDAINDFVNHLVDQVSRLTSKMFLRACGYSPAILQVDLTCDFFPRMPPSSFSSAPSLIVILSIFSEMLSLLSPNTFRWHSSSFNFVQLQENQSEMLRALLQGGIVTGGIVTSISGGPRYQNFRQHFSSTADNVQEITTL